MKAISKCNNPATLQPACSISSGKTDVRSGFCCEQSCSSQLHVTENAACSLHNTNAVFFMYKRRASQTGCAAQTPHTGTCPVNKPVAFISLKDLTIWHRDATQTFTFASLLIYSVAAVCRHFQGLGYAAHIVMYAQSWCTGNAQVVHSLTPPLESQLSGVLPST
eukprot:3801711-Amphidinium_carterae.1